MNLRKFFNFAQRKEVKRICFCDANLKQMINFGTNMVPLKFFDIFVPNQEKKSQLVIIKFFEICEKAGKVFHKN